MKIIVLILLYSGSYLSSSAQRVHVNVLLGLSNYSGDLQPKRYTLNQSGIARGFGLSYDISDKISVRAEYSYAKVMGDDKYNGQLTRNLNFTSFISEGQLALEYYFKDLSEYSASPYIFGGIATYHFNPFTTDTSGNKVYLKYLNTEGEGYYQNRQPYNLNQFAIPFGAGYKISLSDNIRLGIELGARKLFTDYLDDVSTTYVDQNLVLANNGPKAVELAYRGGEIKNGSSIYPPDGTLRGGAKYKDWYYFTVLKISFTIGNGRSNSGGKYSSKVTCPSRVR